MAVKLIKPNFTQFLVLALSLLAIVYSYLPSFRWEGPAALGVAIWTVAGHYGRRLAKLESELATLRSEQAAVPLSGGQELVRR